MTSQTRETGWTRGRAAATALAAIAAAAVVAGCSSSSSASGSAGTSGQQSGSGITLSSHAVAGIGTVLTDSSGRALYTPEQEASGTIKCVGGCLDFWFPVMGSSATASGVSGSFGSIERPDGKGRQLTLDGKPLYTFRLDSSGQVHGNNFTDSFGGQTFNWQAVTTSGVAPAPSAPAAPTSSSAYPGY